MCGEGGAACRVTTEATLLVMRQRQNSALHLALKCSIHV